jgi:1-acyl-sn-glycerol-3-phosphate acyltransferase
MPPVFAHAAFRPGARTLHRWMVPWARLILWGLGVRLRVEHRVTLDPARPVVFVANHQNALDILTAAAGLPLPFGFTPKAALRRMPLVGPVLEYTGSVFVDRSTPHRAARSLVEAGAEVRAGNAVLVFAEGERTWRTALAPFLRGGFLLAVEAGVPLVPVALDGDVGLLDERRWASRPGEARLVVGPPIPTGGRARADVPALMAEVRAWIARELGEEGT